MSHTPVGGHTQPWELKLERASLPPPGPGEERPRARHVPPHLYLPKSGAMVWREETEGSSASSAQSSASPPYLRWARTLQDLLDHPEGVRLFRKFVQDAGGIHLDRLNFWFAVQGLRQESDPLKIRQAVSAIYRFLRKSQLAMPEELKKYVKQSLKDGANIDRTVFDHMEHEVTRCITETTYQAFLRSDVYVSYVSAATQPLSSPDNDPPPYTKEACLGVGTGGGGAGGVLATLHEGEELAGVGAATTTGTATRLTHTALLATQQARRRQPNETPPGYRKRSVYAPHLSYAGYCPASRQSSSRASMSSGRTDSDAVSISDRSSVDGMSIRGALEGRETRHRSHRLHGVDKHAVINKEHDTAMMIPRTQRLQAETLRVLPPAEFAPILIEKLERVKREQESKERLERRLAEGDGDDGSLQVLPPQLVAAAIREKLQVEDDNDQDILDQHVSRVWSERTPEAASPPPRRTATRVTSHGTVTSHGAVTSHGTVTSHGAVTSHPAPRRAPSADSGLHADTHSQAASADHHPHRRTSRKAATEVTDSGVSVVSYGSTVGSGDGRDGRVTLWVAERVERAERARPRGELVASSRTSSTDRDDSKRHKLQKTRGSGSKSSGSTGSTEATCTVVVATFLDDSVPYRIKVPSAPPLTLALLKDYLPRKGNYRYFFKTECADLDNTVIQEEITNDNEVLPMYEGKVMARVKSIE